MIKLSVILPSRNEFPMNCFTIHSILACWEADGYDPKEIEIIIVDNCSNDKVFPHTGTKGTVNYLYGRGAYYNRVIRTIYDPIAGNHSARNKGALIARGKYLFFSDAHVAYHPGFFKHILPAVDESGGLVHGVLQVIGAYPPTEKSGGYGYSIKLGEEIKGCVDEQTEILTKIGWKKWNEVNMESEFATVKMDTHEIEFQKPRDILIQKHDGEMYQFTGRSVDAFLTSYHRCPYISQTDRINKKHVWREKLAKDIKSTDRLPLGTEGIKIIKKKYPDYLVELIGWIITEGSYSTKKGDERITIVQYNKNNRKRIISVAKKFGYSFHISKKRGDICIAQYGSRKIFSILPEKKLTFDFLNKLSRTQLELLYKTMIDGDGTRQPTNETFIQKNKETIDAFQYLCILIGLQSRFYVRDSEYFKNNRFSKDPINYVSVKKNRYASNFKIEKKNYRGIVWCPSLDNGSIFIRRNGKTMVSFQTWNNYKLSNDWFYVPAQGHWGFAVDRKQFLKFHGYPGMYDTNTHLYAYGGGEFFLNMKWWMFGFPTAVEPKAIGYHLASGRNYTYDHNDYKENVLGMSYALGMDAWRERAYLNWCRHTRKEEMDIMMERTEKHFITERKFIDKRKKYTFDQVLLDRPWNRLNEKRCGHSFSGLTIFHDTWLDLIKGTEVEVAYNNSKYQKDLDKFIRENLSEFIYKK